MGAFMDNNTKYMFPIICLPYVQFLLLALRVPPEITMQIWVYIIIFMAFIMIVLPLREYVKHQRPADGKDFARGSVVYLNYTSRDKVFGFKGEYEEIKIDWTNEKLNVLEHARVYLRGRRDVLKSESLADREGRRQLRTKEELDLLNAGLNIDMRSPPLEQMAQLLGQVKNVEKTEIIEDPDLLTKKDRKRMKKKELIQAEDELSAYKEGLVRPKPQTLVKKGLMQKISGESASEIKPEILNLQDLGIPSDQQLTLLKGMKVYYRELYHPEALEGYDYLEFDRMFLILPGEIERILATSELELRDYADYVINAQGCDVIWWCMGFVNGTIPIMYCFASENMVKLRDPEEMDSFLKKQTPAFYMRIKIMEHLIYTFLEEGEAFHQVIDGLKIANDGLRKRMDYMIQEYRSDAFITASPDVAKENVRLREKLAKQSKWKWIGIISLGFCVVLILILVFGVAALNFNATPTLP